MINRSSHIEIDSEALVQNVRFIRSLLGKQTELSSVLKANAYGHGIKEILPLLEREGIRHFSVFNAFEARQAFEVASTASTIAIMGDIPQRDIPWVVKEEIEFFVFEIEHLQNLLEEAKRQQKKIRFHLEMETGMNRLGIEQEELEILFSILQENRQLVEIKGVCTHFAGSENRVNHQRIEKQQVLFRKRVRQIKEKGFDPGKLHASCSAALLNFPEWNLDRVRIGILQYGLWPSWECKKEREIQAAASLKPVLSWHTSILSLKKVKKGEYVGYGAGFQAKREMKIAAIPVGYGYGYTRFLSNKGEVLVAGKRAKIIGNINMNMSIIAVDNLNVKIGDPVVLIGRQGEEEILPLYFGEGSSALNYELLARLDKSIPRIVV